MDLKNLTFVLFIMLCVGCDVATTRNKVNHEIDSLLLVCDVDTFSTARNDEGNKRTLVITCTQAK